MDKALKSILLMSGAGLLPFADDFSTAKSQWTGATWSVAGGVAVNTPNLGLDMITNGDMELDANWNSEGTVTNERSNTQAHGGTYSRHCAADAAFEGIKQTQTAVLGRWVQASAWLYGNGTKLLAQLKTAAAASSFLTTGGNAGQTIPAAWTNVLSTARFLWANASGDFFRTLSAAGVTTADWYEDDVTVNALALAELFRTLPASQASVTAQVTIAALTDRTQAGLVVNLDSIATPLNFVIVYHDRTNIYMDQCVNGIYTNLITAAIAFNNSKALKVIKSNDTYSAWYGGIQYGTDQTITGMNGTIHGLFSTYSGNTLEDYSLLATPF